MAKTTGDEEEDESGQKRPAAVDTGGSNHNEKMYQVIVLAVVATMALDWHAAAQRPTTVQQARAGWQALNAARLADAEEAFAEGLKDAPHEPSLLHGAGITAHLLDHGDAARRFLAEALKYAPSLTSASLLLGDVLYRANDLAGAIQTYEQALTHAPQHRQLIKKLESWRREAALHERFTQQIGDHFTILFEGPAEAALAAKAADVLEATYWRVGSALYTYPTDVITVVLYSREQFRDVTRAPEWAGGSYDGRIRVPVLGAMKDVREFERVLAHEFVHALVSTIASVRVPVWLNEGLAMNFDGTELARQIERARSADSPHALSRLERPFADMAAPSAAIAYAQSAAAVKLLLDEAGAPAIVGILIDVGRGLPFGEAFERNANLTYADFQKRF